MDGNDSDGDKGDYFNPEEEIGIEGAEKINLPKVDIKTGEEDEEIIFKIRARIYRWRLDEWKERGTGEIKILRHKENKKIRLILRQDKTLKAVANFFIADDPLCILKEHQGSDKMFFFMAYDCSDDVPAVEKYVLKFGNADLAAKFKKSFNEARDFNKAVKAGGELVYAPVLKEEEDEEKKDTKKTEENTEKKDEK
jgi:Ran-binding protein 1